MSAALGVSQRTTGAAATALDLYEHHGQRVFGFCLSRLRNADEAQDAAQTTFMYVLTALRRGVVPRNELAWLLTIADNVCRSTRRSLGRRRAHIADADVNEVEAAAIAVSAETGEEIKRLRSALERLPESQRRAILLREWQGLSYADIADQLGITVAAVETLLFRARKSLARHLGRSRARLGALDAASLLSLSRSLLSTGTGKVAAGAAGLAIAVGPAVGRDFAATTKTPAVASRPAPARVPAAPTMSRPRPSVHGSRTGLVQPRPASRAARRAQSAPVRPERYPPPAQKPAPPTGSTQAEATAPVDPVLSPTNLVEDTVATTAAAAEPLLEPVQKTLPPALGG